MRKIIKGGMILSGLILANTTFATSSMGNISLTQSSIESYKAKGYILSNDYTSYSECNEEVRINNEKFPDYKRSQCFINGDKYNYFICEKNDSCSITSGLSSQGIPKKTIPEGSSS